MSDLHMSRRELVATGVGGGFLLALPARSWAQVAVPTSPIETRHGRVRGSQVGGVSRFLGIPYGQDTRGTRFQPSIPPASWGGVRECTSYGLRAPQSVTGAARALDGANPEYLRFLGTLFGGSTGKPESDEGEDCLVLNVWTPDASSRRKRPVMFYLHGGGFTMGSGGAEMFDGSALVRRGDVVVVTINHRVSAMGYLYLGDFHADFADSGNVGQLDIIDALKWVRDNIEAFGGDPQNVTIFGESGGGFKVGALLGTPSARGLFHKAIQESGAGVTMVDRDVAVGVAERTLASLGIAKADVRKLQSMDPKTITAAAVAAQGRGGSGDVGKKLGLGPVVDGRTLPAHPFEPQANPFSEHVPVLIGSNKDEQTLFLAADPKFGKYTVEEAREHFAVVGERADAAFELYRGLTPNDPPSYWVSSLLTDIGMRGNSIREAERKAAQNAAPVFMYRLDWETPIMGGMLRAPHGLDTPLVFDNPETSLALLGNGPDPKELATRMSQAWVNFARTGDPSQPGLVWPRYELADRRTMIFDIPSHVVSDPDGARRTFWSV
ncbi:para-nitrobenzyl esterase [Novosphingobium sp. PhB165]|uniref:carboxylesterase/lipase family protein n=1 Tax=Novosphingobium sp. PhB165 TaxID=2485105 RepID=UPI001051917E|nr:carboxylesterase family protein [Novosphingobium sp. PhB165]TCM16594.1 para-nitrobenzyl esterase [Novosphingobium sp. PhB165]